MKRKRRLHRCGRRSKLATARRRLGFRGRRLFAGLHLPLGDAGRLPAAVAQVIELGAADHAAALDLDGLDHRAHHREQPLDALAEADLAHGEALVDSLAAAGDADALIGLDALALAFLDLHVDAHGVARLEVGDLAEAEEAVGLFLLQGLDHVHGLRPYWA